MLSSIQLNEMSQVDINTVDPDALANISDVSIDPTLPQTERIEQYLRQIQNPYCFMSGETPVKIRFTGAEKPLSQALQKYFSRLKKK